MFPSNLNTTDGERLGLVMTPAILSTDIYTVVRKRDRESFPTKEQVTVAVEENDPNDEAVMLDHFPEWQSVSFPDMQACLKAVKDGKADCTLISNYQYNSLSKKCEQYDLIPLATGEETDFFFAVNRGNNALYSILTRTTNLVSSTTVNASLSYYSAEETAVTPGEFIRQNPILAGAVLLVLLALIVIIALQHRIIVVRREADESRHRVEDLNKQIFVDALTHVRNRGGYDAYIQKLQSRLDQGEALEMAIGVFDCDNLKRINDLYGHDRGNLYLRASSDLICRIFLHSPVFRIGGDEFVVVLQGEDYENRDALLRQFEAQQAAIVASAENEWEKVSVSFGFAVFDPLLDLSPSDLARRADRAMYENKHTRKARP